MASPDLSALTGAQRDVASAVGSLFSSYGISSLSSKIVDFVRQGMSADTVSIELQNTPEYKARFAANDARLAKGLPVLSPAQYISTEESYRQIMNAAGLPTGFYDSHTDFQKFLENDVSPTEVQQRVQAATDAIHQAPPGTLDLAKKWYGVNDLVAYALDPDKATAAIERNIKASEAGALGAQNGLSVSQGLAEQIGSSQTSLSQLQQGFGAVGQEAPTALKLGGIYGQGVTADDLVKETFLNDAAATNKLKSLASQERAAFGGTGAANKSSLSTDTGGSF
jgi:hypothetical protein